MKNLIKKISWSKNSGLVPAVIQDADTGAVLMLGYMDKASLAKTLRTKKVWFYQLNLVRNLGKGNPLNEKDLAEFVKLQKTKADSENSWSVDVTGVDQETFDLSVKNPNKKSETALRKPEEIIKEMDKLDTEIKSSILSIKKII